MTSRTTLIYVTKRYQLVCNITRPVNRGGEATPRKIFASPGKMCWTYFETIGHSLKIFSPSQKTLRPPWCPKLVMGLV